MKYTIKEPDWTPYRKAVEKATLLIGEESIAGKGVPERDWNICCAAIDSFMEERRKLLACVECKCKLNEFTVIRCLDCKMTLCERCAPSHFWPKGRPASTQSPRSYSLVINEKKELGEKYDKLCIFLDSDDAKQLEAEVLDLLHRQEKAMADYLATLSLRINKFGVDTSC